ncbi:ECF RNA polymerase sigma factor SigK [Herbidospora mongoliensis]|uniref:ECF RNA polymerase sigma factor SigK n=1 Tax=Herbidospora mongoliensis TaxID=688067 RepID=UPI003F6E95FC
MPITITGRNPELDELLVLVARGDEAAFERLYDRLIASVFGLIRRVVRDRAQAEEVAQEVMVEVWRSAARFDPARGSAMSWVMTVAHRRAVDRVRSAQASTDRENRVAQMGGDVAYDHVAETVTTRLEGERVRRCIDGLTELQRQAVTMAYYGGYSYPEVAGLLKVPLGTVKTRMRDGLVRLRDCMGVER